MFSSSHFARDELLLAGWFDDLEDLLDIVDSSGPSLGLSRDEDEEKPNWASNFTPVQHRRRIYLDTRQQLDTEKIMLLHDLYRNECEAKNDIQDLTIELLFDGAIPQPKRGLEGGAFAQMVQQGPKLNTADVELLGRAMLQQITCDADRKARDLRLIVTANTLPTYGLPPPKERLLEEFFLVKSKVNQAEIFILTLGFQIPRRALEYFFESKLEVTNEVQEWKSRLLWRRFLRRIEKRGMLEEVQQIEVARARSIQDMKRDEAGRNPPQQ